MSRLQGERSIDRNHAVVINQDPMNFKFDLKPPPPTNEGLNKVSKQNIRSGFFEIYVSRFDKSTSCEDIVNHIIRRTNCSADTFAVDMLANQHRLQRNTFISFKISTFRKDTCDMLLDEKLWAPNFSARLFDHQPRKERNVNFENNPTGRRSQHDRNVRSENVPRSNHQRWQDRPEWLKKVSNEMNGPRNEYHANNEHNAPPNYLQRRRSMNSFQNPYQYMYQDQNGDPNSYYSPNADVPINFASRNIRGQSDVWSRNANHTNNENNWRRDQTFGLYDNNNQSNFWLHQMQHPPYQAQSRPLHTNCWSLV